MKIISIIKFLFFNIYFPFLLPFRCLIFLLIKYNFVIEDPFWIPPFNPNSYDKDYRKPSIVHNSTKKPIVLFGCSFAAGSGLKDDETLSARISQLTNRSVYNRGDEGLGPQMMLYQLQTKKIKHSLTACVCCS